MTIFEAISFFRTLGTSWHDPHLDSTVRTQEIADQWREAERIICSPQAYSVLPQEDGYLLAQEAIRLYDIRSDNTDCVPHQVLMQLAKHVPGALRHFYREIIARQLYWGDGITFHEADQETCRLLISLLETDLEALPGGSRTRADILQALAWAEDKVALEAFEQWSRKTPAWAGLLNQPIANFPLSAGWILTEDGQREYLYQKICYALVPLIADQSTTDAPSGPVSILAPAQEHCMWCERPLKYLFDIDLTDSRLSFFDTTREHLQILLCPICSLEGDSFFTDLDGSEKVPRFPEANNPAVDSYANDTHILLLQPLMLGATRNPYETVSLYWSENLSQIGGHPEWVQYPDYPLCPDCDHLMTFIAQLGITDVDPGREGMIYAFLCSTCGTATTSCQST